MTQYSRHPSGFCRREPFIAGAKADSYPVEDGAGQPLQRMTPVEGRGTIIAARTTYMNDLAVQEAVFQQQCDEETAALQINAELARHARYSAICSITNNRTDMNGGIE